MFVIDIDRWLWNVPKFGYFLKQQTNVGIIFTYATESTFYVIIF
jgi:hypothetical protein